MKISLEKSGDGATLTISGELGIETGEALKSGITEAFGIADRIDLDLSGVTSLDLCSMQLLCSAHRTAAVSGKQLLLMNVGEAFSSDRRTAGYMRHTSCHRGAGLNCLWLE
ncbi:MAG: anti-sigma factor antagonist [Deltaproteobacteria bacterium]|nr:anti-sigma factor antagonist [Deltaproteobacteria bacterium]